MQNTGLHRFELEDCRYAVDTETCFCFECDAISWDVLEHYPQTPPNGIVHRLRDRHPEAEVFEVIGELEWLRACKSILPQYKPEDEVKRFELEQGVRLVTVQMPAAASLARRAWFSKDAAPVSAAAVVQAAARLLLARSGMQNELRLEICTGAQALDAAALATMCEEARQDARAAGKKLTVAVRRDFGVPDSAPEGCAGHSFAAVLELSEGAEVAAALRAFASEGLQTAKRLVKLFYGGQPGVSGRILIEPRGTELAAAVRALDELGFLIIEIEVDAACIRQSDAEPVLRGLFDAARYYAERLAGQHYFRLDPIADLFGRIYHGTPIRRSDPVGTNELAIGEDGTVYPSRHWLGMPAFATGNLGASLDEAALKRFEDVGALTTPACLRCWARHLCGGGTAAVHQALSGSFRTPHAPWCDAQRAWMERAVVAFNRLSSEGINFTRIYENLSLRVRPSLWTMAKAAFRMQIGLRPIEEADAEWLTQWEQWNTTAYFLAHENGLLMATKYDREMDALHPQGFEQEFVLLRKTGESLGLLRLRPDRATGRAYAWLFFRDPADYASDALRKSFRFLLDEAGKQQGLRTLLIPVGPKEDALAAFLEAVGFANAGILREAFFLHGEYHPLRIFSISLSQ
jgi:uncharacterized protein